MPISRTLLFASSILLAFAGCGDDGNEADRLGVGAQCATDTDCPIGEEVCLTEFTGGYCGLADCVDDTTCPEGSACLEHEGRNYCFRICEEKAECNANRDPDVEANCNGSEWIDTARDDKACVPPSGT